MKIKRDKLLELLNTEFLGKYNHCARILGIDPSHLRKYINSGIGGGKKIISAIYRYCISNDLDFNSFIDL